MGEFIGGLALMGIIYGGIYYFNGIQCHEKAESFEQVKYGVFSGCMVKHKGRWLPLENIRGFD